ncbi:hypothetical protein BU24DRAFT_406598 [Aaosphaeria arxii CBS 175.79]|uniref:Uncharacterized protein n=1 Tax=Aaosphaeria arxii CBS 175.79 TaxID=1450172 RepID=A0A6A5Y416_9PLEO|nr:uncharacterized protein BU24DRAFT_406598 [Aaosphaeria arxii CBS 175.79]KAF2019996.1 hypothetical protein BU24DRAFT_406598 [Aaosphaeria arxii CBS 175.79]
MPSNQLFNQQNQKGGFTMLPTGRLYVRSLNKGIRELYPDHPTSPVSELPALQILDFKLDKELRNKGKVGWKLIIGTLHKDNVYVHLEGDDNNKVVFVWNDSKLLQEQYSSIKFKRPFSQVNGQYPHSRLGKSRMDALILYYYITFLQTKQISKMIYIELEFWAPFQKACESVSSERKATKQRLVQKKRPKITPKELPEAISATEGPQTTEVKDQSRPSPGEHLQSSSHQVMTQPMRLQDALRSSESARSSSIKPEVSAPGAPNDAQELSTQLSRAVERLKGLDKENRSLKTRVAQFEQAVNDYRDAAIEKSNLQRDVVELTQQLEQCKQKLAIELEAKGRIALEAQNAQASLNSVKKWLEMKPSCY